MVEKLVLKYQPKKLSAMPFKEQEQITKNYSEDLLTSLKSSRDE